MKYLKVMIVFLIGLVLTPLAFSQDSAEYSDIAKKKKYPGGIEESDLKILPASHFQKKQTKKSEDANEGF